ncbi:hypothetical protein Tco_0933462, partial [Tanacetum coccineum]
MRSNGSEPINLVNKIASGSKKRSQAGEGEVDQSTLQGKTPITFEDTLDWAFGFCTGLKKIDMTLAESVATCDRDLVDLITDYAYLKGTLGYVKRVAMRKNNLRKNLEVAESDRLKLEAQ